MKTIDREELLDNIIAGLRKYANQINLKTYDPSVHEWIRVEQIKQLTEQIKKEVDKR